MSSNEPLLPIGAWLRLELPGQPPLAAFTYIDREAGFSAHGLKIDGSSVDQGSRIIVRLPMPGMPWRPLTEDEIRSFGLDNPPSWVAQFYGPQPETGGLWGGWREHPQLKGRFLPDYPDDLQVLVHDGGPRLTPLPAEAVWVSVIGMDGDVFRGRVLNQPHNLKTVRQGSAIRFLMAGVEFPVMVTDKYWRERSAWTIHPCKKCGLSELFDAPSDLQRVVFPGMPAGAQMQMFTALCPLCGGFLGVESSGPLPEDAEPPPAGKRPWWRFW